MFYYFLESHCSKLNVLAPTLGAASLITLLSCPIFATESS
jgi:hypothetical protein